MAPRKPPAKTAAAKKKREQELALTQQATQVDNKLEEEEFSKVVETNLEQGGQASTEPGVIQEMMKKHLEKAKQGARSGESSAPIITEVSEKDEESTKSEETEKIQEKNSDSSESEDDVEEIGKELNVEGYIVPEGLPGSGLVIKNRPMSDIDVISEELQNLPIKSLNALNKLGPRKLSTPSGEMTISGYYTMLIKMTTLYYKDVKKAGLSEKTIENILFYYKNLHSEEEVAENNDKEKFLDFLDTECVGYWPLLVGSFIFDIGSKGVDNVKDSIDFREIKSRLSALENCYPEGYHVYSLLTHVSELGPASVTPVPPYLKSNLAMDSYLDAVCRGSSSISDFSFKIIPRKIPVLKDEKKKTSKSNDQEGAKQTESKKRSFTLGLVSSREEEDDTHLKKLARTKTSSVTRDTSAFVSQTASEIVLLDKIESLENSYSELSNSLEELNDKVDTLIAGMSELSGAVKVVKTKHSTSDLGESTRINKALLKTSSKAIPKVKQEDAGKSGIKDKKKKKKRSESIELTAGSLIEELEEFDEDKVEELIKKVKSFFTQIGEESYNSSINPMSMMIAAHRHRLITALEKFSSNEDD